MTHNQPFERTRCDDGGFLLFQRPAPLKGGVWGAGTMRRRISTAAVAVVLCLASSTALAHGIEVFIQFLVVCSAIVGLVGGVATVVLPYRALRSAVIGFVASEGLLFAVGMV